MSDFDRIEEQRELVAGLEYEEWAKRMRGEDEDEVEESEEAEDEQIEEIRE